MEESVVIEKLIAGSQEAFSTIYKRYSSLVSAFLLKYVKSPDLAEDLTQEIFLKIWQDRTKLTEVNSFRSYLFTISRNHTFNFLKRASVDKTAKAIILQSYNPYVDLEQEISIKDYLRYIESLLEALPPQSREVFKLCRQEFKTYDEAAEILGISRNTIKKHMVRSMKILGDNVKKDLNIDLILLLCLWADKN